MVEYDNIHFHVGHVLKGMVSLEYKLNASLAYWPSKPRAKKGLQLEKLGWRGFLQDYRDNYLPAVDVYAAWKASEISDDLVDKTYTKQLTSAQYWITEEIWATL